MIVTRFNNIQQLINHVNEAINKGDGDITKSNVEKLIENNRDLFFNNPNSNISPFLRTLAKDLRCITFNEGLIECSTKLEAMAEEIEQKQDLLTGCLPAELLPFVFSNLDTRALANVMLTNRMLHNNASSYLKNNLTPFKASIIELAYKKMLECIKTCDDEDEQDTMLFDLIYTQCLDDPILALKSVELINNAQYRSQTYYLFATIFASSAPTIAKLAANCINECDAYYKEDALKQIEHAATQPPSEPDLLRMCPLNKPPKIQYSIPDSLSYNTLNKLAQDMYAMPCNDGTPASKKTFVNSQNIAVTLIKDLKKQV